MKRLWSRNSIELHEARDGTRTVFYRYQHDGKPHLDSIGSVQPGPDRDKKQRQLIKEARTKLAGVRGEIAAARADGKTWQHPDDLARAARDTAATELGARRELRLDVSVPVYLDECADLYSRPKEHRAHFGNLMLYFGDDRRADTITCLDMREYHKHRRDAAGVFSSHKPCGQWTPDSEVSAFSAYCEWLIGAGHNIVNPCRDYKSRIRVGKKAHSTDRHVAHVPTDAEREAIFSVDPTPPARLKARGREVWRQKWVRFRAVLRLAYYLGGPRPESELCRLRWQDVVFPEDAARFSNDETPRGWVMFVKTKTDVPRSVPMHPEAEAALRSLVPADPDPAAYVLHQRKKPYKAWTQAELLPTLAHGPRRACSGLSRPGRHVAPRLPQVGCNGHARGRHGSDDSGQGVRPQPQHERPLHASSRPLRAGCNIAAGTQNWGRK